MEKKPVLSELQNYYFAAFDMLLYLDTHPDDKKAFNLFKELVQKAQALKADYEKNVGPLSAFSSALYDKFTWLDSPWPWEKEAN